MCVLTITNNKKEVVSITGGQRVAEATEMGERRRLREPTRHEFEHQLVLPH